VMLSLHKDTHMLRYAALIVHGCTAPKGRNMLPMGEAQRI